MEKLKSVTAGFLPLNDCMLLIVAKELGFAEQQGIELILKKEMSWANIRDHMAVGHYEVAHMLAPMPIAFNAGLAPFSIPVIAPMAMGLGGNAITASTKLWSFLEQNGAINNANPITNGRALKAVIEDLKTKGSPKLRFGVVHPFSGHNFELRYWLSSCGIDPEEDVEIVIIPPPLMSEAIASSNIDGYCVGEPWNSVAIKNGQGVMLTTKAAIWHSSPEKVLGVQTKWAEQNPETLNALLRSIYEAAKWCAQKDNHNQLSKILAHEEYLGVSDEIIIHGLNGSMPLDLSTTLSANDFFIPLDRAATFPWQSHALWFYSQMVRWGQISHSAENLKLAKQSYRPDLYRAALGKTDAAIPAANMKVEGALKTSTAVGSSGRLMLGPDGFFDQHIFDPDNVEQYIAEMQISKPLK